MQKFYSILSVVFVLSFSMMDLSGQVIFTWEKWPYSSHEEYVDSMRASRLFSPDSIGMAMFLVDTIQVANPIYLYDAKKETGFIRSASESGVLNISNDSPQKLLDSGWALTYWDMGVFSWPLIHNKKYFELEYKYYLGPAGGVGELCEIKSPSKKYKAYRFNPVPDCFLLIMISGEAYNKYICDIVSCSTSDLHIKFKNNKAYYPLVVPLYKIKSQ